MVCFGVVLDQNGIVLVNKGKRNIVSDNTSSSIVHHLQPFVPETLSG
jgi:hypothetical protein